MLNLFRLDKSFNEHVAKTGATRLALISLFCILALAALLRLLCFGGFDNSDTATYSHIAYQMTQGVWQLGKNYGGPAVSPLRLGVVGPVALLYKYYTVSEFTLLLLPFTLSLCNILLAFIGGKVIQGTSTGLAAAAICAILPIEVHTATILLPDLPQSFGINACFVSLICAARCKQLKYAVPLSVIAGLMFVYGWISKEIAVYAIPAVIAVCAFMLFSKKGRVPLVAAFVITVGAGFGVEAFLYSRAADDPLFRFHEISRFTTEGAGASGLFVENASYGTGFQPGQYWSALMDRLFVSGPESIFWNSYFGLTPLFGIISLFCLIRRRTESAILVAAWFITIIATFNFGTMSVKFWQPLVIDKDGFDRYLQPIVLPSIILTAWFITCFRFPPDRLCLPFPLLWGAAALTITTSSIPHLMELQSKRGLGAVEARALHTFVSKDEVFYTDDRTKWGFLFFWGYPNQTRT